MKEVEVDMHLLDGKNVITFSLRRFEAMELLKNLTAALERTDPTKKWKYTPLKDVTFMPPQAPKPSQLQGRFPVGNPNLAKSLPSIQNITATKPLSTTHYSKPLEAGAAKIEDSDFFKQLDSDNRMPWIDMV